MGQAPSVEPRPVQEADPPSQLLDLILRVAGVSFPFSAEGGNCVLILFLALSYIPASLMSALMKEVLCEVD